MSGITKGTMDRNKETLKLNIETLLLWKSIDVSGMKKKFETWVDLPNGGRVYSYEIKGHHGWTARYVKEVDSSELTVRFFQEIYNNNGKLVEVHEKYPIDKGHEKVAGGEPYED